MYRSFGARPACDDASVPIRVSLAPEVERFVEPVASALSALSVQAGPGRRDTGLEDATIEAFNLSCAVADADGRHTDAELWELLATFGPRFPTQLSLATPDDLRRSGLLAGKRSWLEQPSPVFDLLVRADAKHATANGWTYYWRAMDLAQLIVALDARPTETELRSLDAFRTMLIRVLDRYSVPRPGAGPASVAPGGSGVPTAAIHTPAINTTETAVSPSVVAPEPLPPPEPIDDLLAELDALVGLDGVKAEVRLVTNLLQIQTLRKDRGLPVFEASRHLVFTGNPGTGKTTVARLLARIYRTLGVVEKGYLVETDRAGLVAGFVGQTALKVRDVFDSAMGGILLIDEAYALARGGERDFGREAIDTIVKLIEDRRDALVVVAAGYPDEMAEFIDANPGLRSRFPKTIAFADYSDDELVRILATLCLKNRYEPTSEADAAVRAYFAAQPRTKGFGNGRLARNLFEAAVANQASRLMGRAPDAPPLTDAELLAIEAADIPVVDGAPATMDSPTDAAVRPVPPTGR